jgi:hypothetical protein
MFTATRKIVGDNLGKLHIFESSSKANAPTYI